MNLFISLQPVIISLCLSVLNLGFLAACQTAPSPNVPPPNLVDSPSTSMFEVVDLQSYITPDALTEFPAPPALVEILEASPYLAKCNAQWINAQRLRGYVGFLDNRFSDLSGDLRMRHAQMKLDAGALPPTLDLPAIESLPKVELAQALPPPRPYNIIIPPNYSPEEKCVPARETLRRFTKYRGKLEPRLQALIDTALARNAAIHQIERGYAE